MRSSDPVRCAGDGGFFCFCLVFGEMDVRYLLISKLATLRMLTQACFSSPRRETKQPQSMTGAAHYGCSLKKLTRSTPPLLRLILSRGKADRLLEGADEVGVVIEAGQLARIRDGRAFAEQLLRFVNALK